MVVKGYLQVNSEHYYYYPDTTGVENEVFFPEVSFLFKNSQIFTTQWRSRTPGCRSKLTALYLNGVIPNAPIEVF